MASNFIDLKDAAQMLGMNAEDLTDIRSKGGIYGYRDGSTWKFKSEELERYASSEGIELGSILPPAGAGSGIDDDLAEMIDVDELVVSDDDSILFAEEKPNDAGDSHTSTIIGAGSQEGGSGILGNEETGEPESDVKLVADDASESGVKLVSGESNIFSDESGEIGKGESDTAKLDLDADPSLSDDGIDFASDLSLESDLDFATSDSAINFEQEEGDEIVLGSGVGGDVTLASEGSGINIGNPIDSGLSLEEEPLDLAPQDEDQFELGEADVIELEEMADPEAATQLKADDDFLLTPVEGAFDDSESGSQVIALDSEEFGDSDESLFGAGEAVSPLLEAEDHGVDPLDMAGGLPAGGPSPLMAPLDSLPDAPYSIANVLLLVMTLIFLTLTGLMLVDLHRFMWSWGEPSAISSWLMDSILSLFKK